MTATVRHVSAQQSRRDRRWDEARRFDIARHMCCTYSGKRLDPCTTRSRSAGSDPQRAVVCFQCLGEYAGYALTKGYVIFQGDRVPGSTVASRDIPLRVSTKNQTTTNMLPRWSADVARCIALRVPGATVLRLALRAPKGMRALNIQCETRVTDAPISHPTIWNLERSESGHRVAMIK